MFDIHRILQQTFPGGGWTVRPPASGFRESWIAERGRDRVFIKPGVNPRPLLRLAELAIAPRVRAAGPPGDPWVIQDHVGGTHPPVAWFADNVPALAAKILTWQEDAALRKMLSSDETSYERHIAALVDLLAAGVGTLERSGITGHGFNERFTRFRHQARRLSPLPLVPSHTDPNAGNVILTHDSVYVIDWDDLTLSDPFRDASLMLWWYVPAARWDERLAPLTRRYGDDPVRERMHWWVAMTSLETAVELAELGRADAAAPFVEDFDAAVQGHGNPKRRELGPLG